MQFLRTASNTYKYSYSDQLMIAAQFPNATAVAPFDVWSDRFGRKIKSGEKGIGLIDDSGTYPKMKYVFDISQSVRYRDVPQPYVWDLQEEFKDEIILSLAGDLSISIEEAVSDFCENTVDSLLSDYQNAVLSEAKSSDVLYGLDDTAINSEFRQAVLESVKFVALTRCGLPTDTVDIDVFRNLSDFSDLTITDILGTAISNISEQVLREIEATVKTVERRNQNERDIEEQNRERNTVSAERGEYDILSNGQTGQTDRFDIYSRSRNISVSAQPDSPIGRENNRTMGTETKKVSERTQGMDVSQDDGRTEPDRSPDRDRQGSRRNDRNTDTGVDGERGRNGTAQSGQSDGMGTPPELDTEQSGRSSADQSDIQVKPKQKRQRRTKKKAAEQVSPVFSSFSAGEQMSLFAAESSEKDKESAYAMSRLISAGTGFVDGKFRIFDYFSEQHTKEEKAKFLSNEYGWGGSYGGGEEFETRPGKGITMKHIDKDYPENNITVHLTYPQLADMIDFLIANDMYITPKDIEERQQRAIFYLKNYDPNNPLEAPQTEKAKAILDSYNIDYSQLLANQPEVETVTPEQVEEMNASISDDTEIPDINAPSVPIEQEETVYTEDEQISSDGENEEMGLEAPKIGVTAEIGFSENRYIDEIIDRIKSKTGGVSFAMANALFEYLDEKQHFERYNPAIHTGWYNKTDFTIQAVIDAENGFDYEGRFDIGDGKDQGGGSLIDHISEWTDYVLTQNPFRYDADELAEYQRIKDILIPFLRNHEQLTDEEQALLSGIKHDYPIETTKEQYEALIGKELTYEGRTYTLEKIDFENVKATIRDDNTGWMPTSTAVDLEKLLEQNLELLNSAQKEKTFSEQVDEVLGGKMPFYSALKVSDTPEILLSVGCKQLPMLYTQKHLKNAIKPKDKKGHTHGLDINQIKRLDQLISNPLMIIDSISKKNSILIVTSETDKEGLPVMVSVTPNGKGRYELEEVDSNFITSVYGRNNFPDFFRKLVESDNLLYCNKKSQEMFERWGEQYSELTNNLSFDIIIHQSRNIVNENTAEKTENLDSQKLDDSAQEYTRQSEEADNYRITDLSLGQRKNAVKFEDNLAAIRTLKQLEAEDRQATPEEQETLSKYTGWGGFAKVFEPDNKHYKEVKELLTDDEFEAARKSTMTAFYTSPVIIKEMYAKLAEMGMNGGRLLEPSCGIGNFIGMMPGSNTRVTGIELDSLTGRIAKKLYPQAQIQVCGFENSKLKENTFDVAVGNVPFGDIRVYDKKYNPHNLLIHDYFFSKSLDMVKPGGVVAFITSKGTLDKADPTARRLLAEKAEFLGAVRLPNNAFKANAGTEVTSDIIFLQRRTEPLKITPGNEPLWIKTATDSNGIDMNAYFVEHPEQICGTMAMVSGQFGMESTCEPNRDIKLKAALSNIQGRIETVTASNDEEMGLEVPLAAPESLRNCSYFLSDGKPFFYESGESIPVEFPKTKAKKNLEIMAGMVAIRDTVRQLLEMQLDENVTDREIKDVQNTLSALYDDFTSKHGRISDKSNLDILKNDSSLPLLRSLEKFNENGEYIGKADIFSKRTIKAEHIVTKVSTSVDALAVSLSAEQTKGKVDLDYMSQLTGFDKEKIISDLQGVIFKLPNTDTYAPADEYLSGNIRQKLETAQQAFNAGDTSLAVNITALKKSMPERLEASDIDVRLGSTWINPEYIRDFVYQLLNTPSFHRNQYSQSQFIDVQYSPISGAWSITNKGTDKYNVQGNTTYGTKDRTAYELIEDALNLKATTVKVKVEVDGKENYVVDATKTAQARAKQELIMQKFKEWIFADKSRRNDLVETYNRQFNSSCPRKFDGSHLNFVGMNPEIQLRPHQLNAVARCLYGGNTLLAHEVGAGKTFEMIAAAMEGKRLGLHSKSLICVPNHLTEQIGSDFLKLYPNANILVATKKDFEKENRKALMAKIATGNYDAIIIGHSQLEKIPLSQERQERFIKYQIEETVRNIEELKEMNGEKFQIKQAEKTKANLEAKLQKLLNSPKDDTVTFEELGVDKLFVDEAHLFKNLFLATKMQNVSGISTSSDVQKTADLFMKTQYLDELTGGKGIVFATGTPVSNTMCEIYNMMRYLQMDLLREKHLEHFDSWASTFGENVTQMELTPEGYNF